MKKRFLKTLLLGIAVAFSGAGTLAWATSGFEKLSNSGINSEVTSANDNFVPMLTKESGKSTATGRKNVKALTPAYAEGAPTDIPVLYGNVFATDDKNLTAKSMYKIPTSASEEFVQLGGSSISANYGGVEIDGTYWAHTILSGIMYYVRAYKTEDWSRTVNKSSKIDRMATDLAYDPVGKKVYGCFYNSKQSAYEFGTIDYTTYDRPTIAELKEGWNACACDAKGNLYAITMSGVLYSVNKETGAMTKIGSTGVVPKYLTSATIDPKTGRMFWTVCPEDECGYLYEVNTTTGKATLIYKFPGGEEVVGLYIAPPEAEEKAPAAVTDLALDFAQGALNGSIKFNAPTTTYDGNSATGELNYTIEMDGKELATGTTSYGSSVDAKVTIEKDGIHKFVVRVSNSVGQSPKAQVSGFIGKDTPKAPVVTSAYANGKFTVSWDPVTESVDGGYMNLNEMTYTVVRVPGDTIAKNIKTTSIEDAVPEPATLTDYYYNVTASVEGKKSAVGKSNVITLGHLLPPYSETFETAAALNIFTIIDGNNDGKKWAFNANKARLNYCSSGDQDDWLILPPIKLEKNKIYTFSLEITTATSYFEKFEVKYGKTNTAAGMTEQIVEPTEVKGQNLLFSGDVIADEDCVYYIGIHGISKKNQFYLDVDNLNLSEGSDALVPSAPSAIAIVPDAKGANKAEITVTAPKTMLSKGALASLDKVELYRDSVLINTFKSPAVGSELKFTDENVKTGIHYYEAVAYNDHGKGRTIVESAFVGVNTPSAVTALEAKETANIGEVSLKWETPATDKDGYKINPELISYDIASICGTDTVVIAKDLKANTLVWKQSDANTAQKFYYYMVNAKTSAGATPAVSRCVALGKADATPYLESFANGQSTHVVDGEAVVGDCNWRLYSDKNDLNVVASDGDNGFAASQGEYGNDAASIFTGKIDMSGVKTPLLMFSTYNIPSSTGEINDRNILETYVVEGDKETMVKSVVLRDLVNPEWCKVYVPLTTYANKIVQLKWLSKIASYKYTLLDDVRVVDWLKHDLTIANISAPAKIPANEEFTVDVIVENLGTEVAKDYKVALYAGNKKLSEVTGAEVASLACDTIQLKGILTVAEANPAKLYAEIEYAADLNKDNNKSDEISSILKVAKYPAPTGLLGEKKNDSVSLQWNEPDTDAKGTLVKEGFENEISFAVNDVDDWTILDRDGANTYGITGISFPGSGKPMGFIVLDTAKAGLDTIIEAHSGKKLLASFCAKSGQNDDWAISPRLDGSTQKVSFYAASFDKDMPESFEFYYSTESTETDKFVKLGDTEVVPDEWKKYEYTLPQGARYFAVRCTSKDQFIFMLDDFEFVPAGPGEGLTLLGFNVYRNQTKINEKVVEEPSYVDLNPEEGKHTYSVSAVYDKGESALSNNISLEVSSVMDMTVNSVKVIAETNRIVITGAEGQAVRIYTTDGKLVYSVANATNSITCTVNNGIYVVAVGNTSMKVLVK